MDTVNSFAVYDVTIVMSIFGIFAFYVFSRLSLSATGRAAN